MAAVLTKPNEISPDLQDKVQIKVEESMSTLKETFGNLNSEEQLKSVSAVSNMANRAMESSSLMVNLQKENDTDILSMKSLDNTGGNSSKVSINIQ